MPAKQLAGRALLSNAAKQFQEHGDGDCVALISLKINRARFGC